MQMTKSGSYHKLRTDLSAGARITISQIRSKYKISYPHQAIYYIRQQGIDVRLDSTGRSAKYYV